MIGDDQFSSERAADRLEIQHRIHQFARSVDRRDWAGARAAYHDDAHIDYGAFRGTPDELIAWITKRHDAVPFSLHSIANVYIVFSGPDEAFVESYVLGWQTSTPEGRLFGESEDTYDMFGGSRYVDRFTRRDGRWRVQDRIAVLEASMRIASSDDRRADLPTDWPKAARDESDPAEVLRRGLGLS